MKGRQRLRLMIMLAVFFGTALLLPTGPRTPAPSAQDPGKNWLDDRLVPRPLEGKHSAKERLNAGAMRPD
ncbi:MAG TPA: hypothetical protein VG013_05440 [Gemmataceae bacterium]|jgi:hypothetical protein|nr:hypothetical protein [Gemmataceae bacterium]